MTKDELLGIYRTSQNNCKLVYAAIVLFSHEDMPAFYNEWSSALDFPNSFNDRDIAALLSDEEVSKIAFSELFDTVHRAALKELFEITKYYCSTTGQMDLFRAQTWYQFWRIIRNCFSHDFRFRFSDHDRKMLPVSWAMVTIDENLEGKPLTHGVLSREQVLNFISEVQEFVNEQLA